MKIYEVTMSDGIFVEVKAFNKSDAMRTAERKMRMQAFGSRALKAKTI